MDNLQTTKIKSGITVNAAKRIKISRWDDLINNARKMSASVKSDIADSKPDFNKTEKPEWDLVNISDSVVNSVNSPKPIRIMGRGVEQSKKSWDSYRQENIYGGMIKNDFEAVENENTAENEMPEYNFNSDYDNSVSSNLEGFGYSEDFSKAVEETVDNTISENKEPQTDFQPLNFEVPNFDEYEEHRNDNIEMSTTKNDTFDLEEIVRKALNDSYNKEENKKEINDNEEVNNKVDTNNLQINDLMMEIAQVYEANTNLEGNINTFNNRNNKMERSINSINKETKDYEELSLKNAREILIKAKEKQEMLRKQEEEAINLGKDLQERLINADEANLSAKKRSEYLFEMLNDNNYSESYNEETYKKVA